MEPLHQYSDEELVTQLIACAFDMRRSKVRALRLLVEIEDRRVHLRSACSSLFDYCKRFLLMSHGAAYRFATCARLCRKYPFLLERIQRGELHLSTLTQIASFITPENVHAIVDETAGKRRFEIEMYLAKHFGKEPMRVSYGGLPCDAELLALMDRARQLFSHSVALDDTLELTKRAYRALIEKGERQLRAKADRPRPAPLASTKTIPRSATREMFDAHREQCSFVDARTGARCQARCFLQRHHVYERALGGSHQPSNLAPLCAAHNLYEAEVTFGREYVQRRIRARQEAQKQKQAKKDPPVSFASETRPRSRGG